MKIHGDPRNELSDIRERDNAMSSVKFVKDNAAG